MLSFEAIQAHKNLLENRDQPWQPIEARRDGWESSIANLQFPSEVKIASVQIGSITAEWIEHDVSNGVILWLHGGGFNSGSSRTHRELGMFLSQATGCKVLNIDYRLAPEHPFPAALEDTVSAYLWLLEQEISAKNIVIGGDSAGGQLVVSALLRLRDAGVALPRATVLLSPWVDLTMSGESINSKSELDPMVKLEDLQEGADWYLAGHDPRDTLASPVFAELHSLPPMLIQVGEFEILQSDAIRLDSRAKNAGVSVKLEIFTGMWHVFHAWAKDVSEARTAIAKIAEFLHVQ